MCRLDSRAFVVCLVAVTLVRCGGDEGGITCGIGATDCDGTCTDLNADPVNCGECGHACAGGEFCSAGACVTDCPDGLTGCDGACRDTNYDPANCGACGTECGAGQFCVAGSCEGSCGPLADCDGVCRDTRVDPSNCGDCGVECDPGEVCADGSCAVSCPPGSTDCDGRCIDLDTDRAHCGDCDTACADGEVCDGDGHCALSCQEGLLDCSGTCIDPDTDERFCGASLDCFGPNDGDACADGEVCDGDGHCALSCQEGLLDCGGTCIDPDTDERFCGATGDCVDENAGEECADGQLCDGDGHCAANCQEELIECEGHCIDPDSNRSYCGAGEGCAGAVECEDDEVCVDGTCRLTPCDPSGSVTFFYTGAMERFVVPRCVSEIFLEVHGAEGGSSAIGPSNGGLGGYAEGYLDVDPGDTLEVRVGEMGRDSSGGNAGVPGSFNGGGAGGTSIGGASQPGGAGGGGASDVRTAPGLDSRVIVAAGGGGSGGGTSGGRTHGGAGGGLVGGDGVSYASGIGHEARGGTQVAGGANGDYVYAARIEGTDGSLGLGGDGDGNGYSGGGGGGGGYYGGGGGSCHFESGGGGGSSFIDGLRAGVTRSGERNGHGEVTISW